MLVQIPIDCLRDNNLFEMLCLFSCLSWLQTAMTGFGRRERTKRVKQEVKLETVDTYSDLQDADSTLRSRVQTPQITQADSSSSPRRIKREAAKKDREGSISRKRIKLELGEGDVLADHADTTSNSELVRTLSFHAVSRTHQGVQPPNGEEADPLQALEEDDSIVKEERDDMALAANWPDSPRRSSRRRSNRSTIDPPPPRIRKPRGPVQSVDSDNEAIDVLPADQYVVGLSHFNEDFGLMLVERLAAIAT